MRHSDQIDQIVKALSAAQGAMKGAKKDSSNNHFNRRYADLSSVWEACREALTANGLAVVQSASNVDGGVRVSSMLAHVSGQWIADDLIVPVRDAGPQALGSAITYGRRYSLAALVGVAPEDDDAEAAEARPKADPVKVGKPENYELWLTQAQVVASKSGLEALQAHFKAAPAECRKYAVEQDVDRWQKVKAMVVKANESKGDL